MEGFEDEKWDWFEIINACVILHNLIRVEEPNDPLLEEVDHEILNRVNPDGDDQNEEEQNQPNMQGGVNVEDSDRITLVQSTHEWTRFRDALAQAMFIDYQNRLR
ncbi:OLC1v1030528C1 [Oldenlandia corymbosa var. corymbosa]|uniref:OLC1v1030528C1 n=1 Tax=Oldenlandia corymbosa var. corymbosa TaxID=529605 RepID=A0AAV1CH16_OLDCO|nr:OLC1v1030528C1 [Oldenlandia corymbosa var. corymbosa]